MKSERKRVVECTLTAAAAAAALTQISPAESLKVNPFNVRAHRFALARLLSVIILAPQA